MKLFDNIIIGAGPAGLFAAIHIKNGTVLVIEKNSSAGKKLLISGFGRCNITHNGAISEFFNHYGGNHKFLKPALHAFSNIDLIAFLHENGLNTIVDKNDKVFPNTEKANDILQILLNQCKEKGVSIHTNNPVIKIEYKENLFIVTTEKSQYSCRNLIISTGGKSYPITGSSGDGFAFAKHLGHQIILPKPALTPISIQNYKMQELAGVSLQNKIIYLYQNNKKTKQYTGDIIFTHKGLSGPGILDFSRYFNNGDLLKVNLIDLNPDDFKAKLTESSQKEGKISIQVFLKNYDLPKSLIKIILQELSIESDEKLATITKNQKSQLANLFCEYSFLIEKVGGFNVAMTTAGGVSLQEVSSKTMESKLIKNLFFAGEVLDVDGDTGGYNLQAAFSTAYLAVKTINLQQG